MSLIDTHCHIDIMLQKKSDIPFTNQEYDLAHSIITQAKQHSVEKIINVGVNVSQSKRCIELAQKFTEVYAAIGIHPNDCTAAWQHEVRELKRMIETTRPGTIVAIGECGLDKHYPGYNLAQQQDTFKAQIELALTHNLPLIIHTRDAADETLAVLSAFKGEGLRGTIHCFSENLAWAHDAIALGFVLGMGGTITYPKNEHLRDVVRAIPLDHIVLETDAPFLPIQSMRGKQNHPMHIADIATYVAQLKGITAQVVAQETTATAHKLFLLQN